MRPFDRKSHTQIGQRPRNPVIAPVPVLAGHANDQLLDLPPDPRPARASTRLRSIELAGDKLAIPTQDGVRSGYGGDVGESLAAQPVTDLAERTSLGRPRASVDRSTGPS